MLKMQYIKNEVQVPQLTKARPSDAGFDLASNMETIIPSGMRAVITTGIKIKIDEGYYGQVSSRSGLAFRTDIHAFPGVCDAEYRGEYKVLLYNRGTAPFKVEVGMRIAQLVVIPCYVGGVEVVEELEDSSRGEQGFGSSGV
jgi:dUTP pyrophosphatase